MKQNLRWRGSTQLYKIFISSYSDWLSKTLWEGLMFWLKAKHAPSSPAFSCRVLISIFSHFHPPENWEKIGKASRPGRTVYWEEDNFVYKALIYFSETPNLTNMREWSLVPGIVLIRLISTFRKEKNSETISDENVLLSTHCAANSNPAEKKVWAGKFSQKSHFRLLY